MRCRSVIATGPDTPRSATAAGGLLGSFAVPLGLAGLGGVWQALRSTVSGPAWPAEVLFAISGMFWATLTAAYIVGEIRRPGTFTADAKDPMYGPFTAYIPIIGILLASHYEQYVNCAGRVAVVAFVVAWAVLAAHLLAHWLLGNLPVITFHPGHFLPTVAGAFIASIGLALSGWPDAALAAFGVGIFYWLVIGSLIFGRLFTGPPLPDTMKPLMAVLVAPPATAGIAWFVLSTGQMNHVTFLLLGVLILMLLVQALFLSEYRHTPFTANFWTFTFPIAASTNVAVRWLGATQGAGARVWSWSLASVATATVTAIAAATLLDVVRRRFVRPASSRPHG